ncbi:MAG: hypothetical protein CEE38_11775 [Planctomycetes bacterium B3_Pla]|nr:MAG: hypothetical protein CEE38_11775 [Planctomycetes bacterium B3_Pla]
MQRYRYQHGDQPLEGYTIQRAAGRGGFGEVYYAVSDSGREVALKAVQNYEQIELRGIGECMNIKSPHLVTIFDVKYNDRNEPFVLMEFVSGPSLYDLLAEAPGGLGAQKAAFFLREIAKGLSYLHECGIVHRDLKPGNVFYENGYVKIGDYGLAKAISASRHSGHTITVGTVHYMAPEIGAGNYNCSIDIYALGVLLHEMLTGDVPFGGSSPAEILMKHMTVAPELANIEEPFAHVIKKALAKDPADRYGSVQEMVEDLFGSENIQNSVSHFSPEELSVVAEKVAAKANIADQPRNGKAKVVTADEPTREMGGQADVGRQLSETAQRFARQADALGKQVAAKVDARVNLPAGIVDPVDPSQRRTLAVLTMALVAVGAAILHGGDIFPTAITVFVMTAICSKVILYSRQRWFTSLEPESQWVPRIIMCCVAALLASIAAGIVGSFPRSGVVFRGFPFGLPGRSPFGFLFGGSSMWLALAMPMFLVNWCRISSPQRPKRLSLGSAIWIGLLGLVSGAIFRQTGVVVAAVLAGTSLVVQAFSPLGHAVQPAAKFKKARQKKKDAKATAAGSLVPGYFRACWRIGSFVMLGLGLFLLIMAGTELRGDEFAIGVAAGVDSLILSLFCFVRSFRKRFTGWYPYLIKPLILAGCLMTVVTSSICMGNMSLRNDEFLVALFLIIFPAVAFLAVAVIPGRWFGSSEKKPAPEPAPKPVAPTVKPPAGVSSFKRMWALLLSGGGLFGFFGLQRFYVGKIGTGIAWFLTGGMFLIGQIIDLIMICTGEFKDCYGRPLVIWQDKAELSVKTRDAKVTEQAPASPYDVAAFKDQPAEAMQPASEEDAPTPSAAPAPTTVVVSEPWHPLAFLFSGIGFILTFAAVVVGVAVGLHLPHFVAAGFPDPGLAQELEQFFGYSSWPELVMRMGTIIVFILLLLAAISTIIGRRHLGALHVIRTVLGLAGFVSAFLVFSDAMSGYHFQEVVDLLNAQQIGPAFERLLGSTDGEAIFAGVLFLLSVVILAWPARRRQAILTPALNQGIS